LRSQESVAAAETLPELFEIAHCRDTLAATLPQDLCKLLRKKGVTSSQIRGVE